MGKTIDRFLGKGRGLRASKFKPLLNLALTRLTVLKAQRRARCSNSRSDVLHLLQLGHHDRALLRVEQVIKEQNTLDAYLMMESYINLLIERVNLIEEEKSCPDELKEAIATLIYSSSRCGEFPELLEIRSVFQSHFGKEFVARSVELRNNCGVNTKMIQKMSTLQPSLESRTKMLKEIAAENGIVLQLDEPTKGEMGANLKPESPIPEEPSSSRAQKLRGDTEPSLGRRESSELSDSFEGSQKYKDVADAAEAAFKSAAFAAAAARAAVELSRSNGSRGPDDPSSPSPPKVNLEFVKISSQPAQALDRSLPSSSSGSQKELHINTDDEADVPPSEPLAQKLPSTFQSGSNVEADNSPLRLNLEKGPISVRTRRLRGY